MLRFHKLISKGDNLRKLGGSKHYTSPPHPVKWRFEKIVRGQARVPQHLGPHHSQKGNLARAKTGVAGNVGIEGRRNLFLPAGQVAQS